MALAGYEYNGKVWAPQEWCACMGFDAMRISMGGEPKTFTRLEVLTWMRIMTGDPRKRVSTTRED